VRYRTGIAVFLAAAAMAVTGVVAYADNGPHGGFNTTTDACSGCHRAHTASGPGLLKTTSDYALCSSCHGATGTGASTNVDNGLYMGTGGGSLKGGGFLNATMNTNLSASSAAPTTSAHKVVGMTGYTSDTLWGNGAISASASAGPTMALQCSSCHDPHGKTGSGGTATYRILHDTPPPVAGASFATVAVPDVTTKKYTINSATGVYYGQVYPAADDNAADNGKITTLSSWCASCHTRVHSTSTAASGDAVYNRRHSTGGSNVGNSMAGGTPACLTCHVAHGTRAAMGANSSSVPKPGSTTSMLDSSLLRVDNRGVCQSCHNK
jgi:predicted CXXCH cytochrome family protein